MTKSLIYFDHHATTPLDPRVLGEMLSIYQDGLVLTKAEENIQAARDHVASLLGCHAEEILFTSGATESINLALKGVAETYSDKGRHIITQVTEHSAVLKVCEYLEKKGLEVTYLPVDSNGRIDLDLLKKSIKDETILISMMFANNEIGTLQPIEEIGKIAKENQIFFHVDGAQAVGKIPFDVTRWGIDLLSFSAHKLYGPQGVGALYVRKENPYVRLTPQIHGGEHQEGLRSGTLNLVGIVGLGKACQIAREEINKESERVKQLRDQLLEGIQSRLENVFLNGHAQDRLANNLNLSFPGLEGQVLLKSLAETMVVSTGSACLAQQGGVSYVLKAIGCPEEHVHTSIRFGLGRFNTPDEVNQAIETVVETVTKLRKLSPLA